MSFRARNWLILLRVATLTLVADRVSKWFVTTNLSIHESWHPPIPLVQRVFSLTYTTNTGAAFGLFPNQGVLFVVIAVAVAAAIVFYYRHLPAGYGLVRLALGLQLGGALGNLLDRLRLGYVVDFIDLNFWPLQDWPVFNLADSAIVVGVTVLAFAMLREDVQEQEQAGEPSKEAPEGEAAREPGRSS